MSEFTFEKQQTNLQQSIRGLMEIPFLTLGMHVMHRMHTHSFIFCIFVTLTKIQIWHLSFFTIPDMWTVASQQKKTKLLLFVYPHITVTYSKW